MAREAERARPGLRQAVVALQHRDFTLFYSALLVAAIGSQLQSTVNLLQVYELTGSALHLGLTGLVRGIPIMALSLVGGVIADRIDRRQFIILTQVFTGLLSVFLWFVTWTEQVQVWHIYAVVLASGVLQAINSPARSAIIPNLVPRHHLMNAIALNSTTWQASNILGPALAGLAIPAVGMANTYLLNGAAHLVTLVGLALMRVGPVAARPRESPLRSVVEGLRFVRLRSIILVLLAMDSAAVFFGAYRALLPIFGDHLGVGQQGTAFLMAAPGAGSLAGAFVIMSLGDVRHKGLLVVVGILSYCGALVALAVSPWFLLSIGATFLLGAFDSLQATPRNVVIQMITPDELRGRVSAFHGMLTAGVPHLGMGYTGGLAALLGAPLALIGGAAVCAAVVLGLTAARRDLLDPELGSATPRASTSGIAPVRA